MENILNARIGYYSDIYDKSPEMLDFYNAIGFICTPHNFIKKPIEQHRELLKSGKKEEAAQIKNKLPALTFSAYAPGKRVLQNIEYYNQLILLDFDRILDVQMEEVRRRIKNDPHTLMMFTSPSGNGLKVLVKVDSGLEYHKVAYQQVANYYFKITGIDPDRSGSDPLRLCYISHDPYLYQNKNCNVFNIDTTEEQKRQKQLQTWKINEGNYSRILHFILEETTKDENYTEGNRNNFIYHFACNLNRAGISENMALTFIFDKFNDLPADEVLITVKGVYNRHTDEFNTVDYEVKMLKRPKDSVDYKNTPLLPDEIFDTLPHFIRNLCESFKDQRERDVLFLSIIGILSAGLTRLKGTYKDKTVYSNLFIYIVAPAASNKGVMGFAREMGLSYHKQLLQESELLDAEYKIQLDQYQISKKSKNAAIPPKPPVMRKFFIAGNSSAAAMLRQLKDNGGQGIICESEGDTVGNMFKQDWGNFSEILRKAFHHEYLSVNRRDRDDCHEIDSPRLSLVITSTPEQVASIIKSAENGLFSRMLFYVFGTRPEWIDILLAEDEMNLSDHFYNMGTTLKHIIETFSKDDVKFDMEPHQIALLNDFGKRNIKEVGTFVDEVATSVVKRFGLMMYRISMIFTAVRFFDDDKTLTPGVKLKCNDQDAKNALIITETLLKHSLIMFKMLPKAGNADINEQMRVFYDLLPNVFSRKDSISTATRLGLKAPTADKYLSRLFEHGYLTQPRYGYYEKTNRINHTNYTNLGNY